MYTPISNSDTVVTVYKTGRDARGESSRNVRLNDVNDIRELLNPVTDPGDKNELPLIMKRQFDGRRRRENASGRCLLVLDVDHSDGTEMSDASSRMEDEGIPHLIYTTYSHTEELPRYRVVVPVTVESKHVYQHLAIEIFEIMQVDIAPESWAINSGFYAPHDACETLDLLDIPLAWIPNEIPEEQAEAQSSNDAESLDYDRARSALDAVQCDQLSYDDWILIGQALHSTGDARAYELWDEWSKTDPGRYEEDGLQSTETKWSSFRSENGGITIASLYRRATDLGWRYREPRTSPEDDFSDVQPPSPEELATRHRTIDGAVVEQFNRRFALVKFSRTNLVVEDDKEAGNIDMYDVKAFKEQYDKDHATTLNSAGQPVQRGVGSIWLTHENRRSYLKVDFDPNGVPDGTFNLWRKWPLRKLQIDRPDKIVEPWTDHLFENVCNHDEYAYRWVLRWAADVVQNPGNAPGTSLVLAGEQGSGKGMAIEPIMKVMGRYGTRINSAETLAEKFNSFVEGKLMVYANEIELTGRTAKASRDKLKALITDPEISIRRMNTDFYDVKNFTRVVFSSNSDWVVPIQRGDRRFSVLSVSDKRKRDRSYFKHIARVMGEGSRRGPGIDALFCFLRDLDVSDYPDPAVKLDTKAATMMQTRSMTAIELWWQDCLNRGYIGDREKAGWDLQPYPKQELLRVYVSWVEDRKHHGLRTLDSSNPSDSSMGNLMRDMCPGVVDGRKVVNGTRKYCWMFPELERCRSEFDEYMGRTLFDWDMPDEDVDE